MIRNHMFSQSNYLFIVFVVLSLFGSSCNGDRGDPVGQELSAYLITFARNNTPLNTAGGTERSLFRINGDGSNLINLSKHPAGGYPSGSPGYDGNPSYSPSDLYIAFKSSRDNNDQIYRMNVDGSGVMNLSQSTNHDEDFRWSPDGGRIVFARLEGEIYQVYAMNADGTNQINLTHTQVDSRYPDWSPDGTQIVYSVLDSAGSSAFWKLYIMNSSGSNRTALTDSTESSVMPRWSKDGGRIFYTVIGVGMGYRDINGPGHGSLPGVFGQDLSFAPDGSKFVTSGLRIVNRDLQDITPFSTEGSQADWSPDGKWIVFRNSDGNLFLIQPDGSNRRQLTTSAYGDLNPTWQ